MYHFLVQLSKHDRHICEGAVCFLDIKLAKNFNLNVPITTGAEEILLFSFSFFSADELLNLFIIFSPKKIRLDIL